MKYRLTFAVLGLVIFISGCANTQSGSSSHGSSLLENGTFVADSTTLRAGEPIHANVTTDGTPVDVLVLDARSYQLYASATKGNSSSWTARVMKRNVTAVDFNYTVPVGGEYYVVVDNTGAVPGGAPGTGAVRVSTSISFGRPPA